VAEEIGLDSVDKVIWVLPFLGLLDVASTLYVASLGYSLMQYEAGFVAGFFVARGLTYIYAVVYPLSLVVLAYVIWGIKRRLNASSPVDKGVFLFLVAVVCVIYTMLTVAFSRNFLLPAFLNGDVPYALVTWLVCSSSAFTLGIYIWRDVLIWVKSDGKREA
jgi:hypothetical protein